MKQKTSVKLCQYKNCSKSAKYPRLGLCQMHYTRRRRGKSMDAPSRTCSIIKCGKPKLAKGLCSMHYARSRKGQDLSLPPTTHRFLGPARTPEEIPWRLAKSGYMQKSVRLADGRKTTLSEHREVMATIIGRPLLATEEVHHRNGVRHDNRPENLELWSTSQPAGQRVKDKLEWADEIIALYRPLITIIERKSNA